LAIERKNPMFSEALFFGGAADDIAPQKKFNEQNQLVVASGNNRVGVRGMGYRGCPADRVCQSAGGYAG
jgi:hypothetical protein